MSFGWPQAIVLALACQRLAELWLANRNTRRLLAQGAHEVGRASYPLLVAFHAGWLVALFVLAPSDAPVDPLAATIMIVLQAARVWVLVSLGPRWTTRIIVLPGAPLVRRGPYRWVDHPNYLVVAGEIAAAPMMFGLIGVALGASLLNFCLLIGRIRQESGALRVAASQAPG